MKNFSSYLLLCSTAVGLFSGIPAASADDSLIPVDIVTEHYDLPMTPPCGKYLDPSQIGLAHEVVADGLVLSDEKAFTSPTRDQNSILKLEIPLLPGICQQIQSETPPVPPMVNGYMMNEQGVEPAPSDYLLIAGGLLAHDTQNMRTDDVNSHNIALFEDTIKNSSYSFADDIQKYAGTIQWNIHDLIKGKTWVIAGHDYYQDYLDGKPVVLEFEAFYCFTNAYEDFSQGGTLPYRPAFDQDQNGVLRTYNIQRPRLDLKTQSCFQFPIPLRVTLNDQANIPNPNPSQSPTPVPSPSIPPAAQPLIDQFNAAVPTAPLSPDLTGWWAGKCIDITQQGLQGVASQAGTISPALLIAGRCDATVETQSPSMASITQVTSPWYSSKTIYEKADYFEHLSSSQKTAVQAEIKSSFEACPGFDVDNLKDGTTQFVDDEHRDFNNYYELRAIGPDKYIAMMYQVPNTSMSISDGQLLDVCVYDQKIQ